MPQVDLGTFVARGLTDAKARALEYQRQLEEIVSARLRARFLEEISVNDPIAGRLMA